MAKSKIHRQQQPPETNSNTPLIAAAGASALSGSVGVTLTSFPPEDKSFYCKFVKGFNIFKMILFIIVVIVIVYLLYKFFIASKQGKSTKKR